MSVAVPPIPLPPAPARTGWVTPLAQGAFWLCLVCTAGFVLQTLGVAAVSRSEGWQMLMVVAWEHQIDGSLLWMLMHPVVTSLFLTVLCLASTLASWGLWRERRWGLWSFIWMLVLSALANFVIAWWLDGVLLQLMGVLAEDAATYRDLQVQRVLFTLTLVGASVLMAGLQGWLVWRLLRPDVRCRFR
ncbi:MAG: hypothetical protein RR704_05485 [Stenotrophomonas sp.]